MFADELPLSQKRYTVEEFFDAVPDGRKADLIDGVIYLDGPEPPDVNELTYLIRFLIHGCSAAEAGGRTYGPRVGFVLGPRTCVEPDIAFVSATRLHTIRTTHVEGPPDLAVEIVATESQSRDYDIKKRLYEASGVREYWIVDPLEQRCEFYRLAGSRYAPIPLQNQHFFHSKVLPDLWLDTRWPWLLADPLPDEHECLDRILAGPPDTSV